MAGHEITIDGETHNKAEWYRIYQKSPGCIRYRMEKGMTFEEALKKPGESHSAMNPTKVGVKPPVKLATSEVDNRKCRKCHYSDKVDGDWRCCYILEELHRRPCPPGPKCTVDKPKGKRKMNKGLMS